MDLILLALGAVIFVLLVWLARNLAQILQLLQSLQSRIDAIERELERNGAATVDPSSIFAFRLTEPSSARHAASASRLSAGATNLQKTPTTGDKPLRDQPMGDQPQQVVLDDLPILQEPAAAEVSQDAQITRPHA